MKSIILLLLGFLIASCSRATLDSVPETSGVTVHLNWESHELPAGMKFYFYPVAGSLTTPVQADSPAEGHQGALAPGRYSVLTHNPGTSGILFSGMESYATATATAAPLSGATLRGEIRNGRRGESVTMIAQPSLLYVGSLSEGLDVPRFDPVVVGVSPGVVTKTLRMTFDTKSLSGVSEISGELRGLYASVLLSTGEATEAVKQQAPRMGTSFAVAVNMDKPTVAVTYFGILNPEGGGIYKNEMPLTLKGEDGWEQTTVVDLTRVLTDIALGGQDGFEFEMEDEIQINVEPTNVGISAGVTSWTRYGGGEGDIYYTNY